MKTIYLRDEQKKGEHRSPLTPNGAKTLIDAGVKVIIESSTTRIFTDQAYRAVGAEITTTCWSQMPQDTLVLGLKELPVNETPIAHNHIYFAHSFKGQDEAPQVLSRFKSGGGKIFDIEFLTDADNRRVAAFGYWAGFVGAGLGLLGFAHSQQQQTPFPAVTPFADQVSFVNTIKQHLGSELNKLNVMVMGSLGRCGTGATDLLTAVGIEKMTLWDKEEYEQSPKPITAILDQDVFINCVYLKGDIPPMIDQSLLSQNQKLRIISDVSCDPNSANNPIPVYDAITYMDKPFVQAKYSDEHPVYVQAIDHLPTLLPKEASAEFADALLPHLLQLCSEDLLTDVWQKALDLYHSVSEDVVTPMT
ncbi:saccharopine dehydrogenase [Photobacterium sagamiensis]|uniref:saccharopine dehydrogenase n=1 Tax=Photobacterium sagamiensis TaxID=2910241 RepID=UPI003D0A4234